MVELITLDGRSAWLKRYGGGQRWLALRALDGIARRLDAQALRPPPHHAGAHAKQVELRRLSELESQGVPVPAVLGEGSDTLILDDQGPTLASHLRTAQADPQRLDALAATAARAIHDAHRRGAYLGQPLPRNMTFDGERIGFIDFEEDPLEVMTLQQAQARDWLMFSYGASRYYARRPQALAAVLKGTLASEDPAVSGHAHHVTTRLQRVARISQHFGRSARVLAQAIFIVHGATTFALAVVGLLLLDWFIDGELDLLLALT